MTRSVLVVRPEPGLAATLAMAREFGLDARGVPLGQILPIAWQCPSPESFDALLIGSANAIRHGGAQLAQIREKPVHAVGKATAKACEDAGFRVQAVGQGGLQGVLDAAIAPLRFLRLAGATRVALSLPPGISMIEKVAYESVNLPLPREALRGDPLVLVHSATQAAHFADEFDAMGGDRATLALAALGPRIASAAGSGWKAVHVAQSPNDTELLALAASVCL